MKVLWKRRALRDLDEIHAYILQRSKQGAESVVRRIESTVELIGDYPGYGRKLKTRANFRVLPVGKYPYRVYYAVEADAVVIVHVRHTSRRSPVVRDL